MPFLVSSGLIYVAMLLFVDVSQSSEGWGPFRPSKDSPHEGRLVFAGCLQVLLFIWGTALVLYILHQVHINVPRLLRPGENKLPSEITVCQPSGVF